MILDTDAAEYGGHGRLMPDQFHLTGVAASGSEKRNLLSLYLPTRTAIVLEAISSREPRSFSITSGGERHSRENGNPDPVI